jgi:hypothetical protein
MALIITAASISATLSLSLNDADVEQAQNVIELETGADLATADPESRFSAADLKQLRAAVLWQTAYLQAHPEVLTAQTNIASVKGLSAGVTFTPGQDGLLSPLAARALARLSWRAGPVKITSLKPSQPDPGVRVV